MLNKSIKLMALFPLLMALFFSAVPAHAHVLVEPKEVGVGEALKFTVDVPSEQEDKSTISIRLVLPYEMRVGVYTKPGWNAEIKKVPGDIPNLASEIIWSGGEIPTQFKDQFEFYTSVPPEETTLAWKAYQTYNDGSIVAWELDPSAGQPTDEEGNPDFSEFGPYSQTRVINDLQEEQVSETPINQSSMRNVLILSVTAVVLSTLALGILIYKK